MAKKPMLVAMAILILASIGLLPEMSRFMAVSGAFIAGGLFMAACETDS